MAKMKGKGVVLTALAAGVATFLSKKENRDKTMEMISSFRSKAMNKKNFNNFVSENDSLKELAETAASVNDTSIRGNNFIGEGGGQTALSYYNHKQDRS
ncbi:hypothetical protein [Ureibacillus manganicus]|uniref:Uncharacterized protein n=1 Tax=Ureibacillus manganicus DSM 26584 TaxID=1384049 RepID=A0A0A3IM02_9BACL|nr:hypothetical protein [Ureibacillus manganicus]KGR75872.1 hypothetical protein CD29_17595 [Ureibacillus manganicus DSM 26584]